MDISIDITDQPRTSSVQAHFVVKSEQLDLGLIYETQTHETAAAADTSEEAAVQVELPRIAFFRREN